jgi:hypothetical protein
MIHRQYVVTPSVALFGFANPELFTATDQKLAFACHAFLARATFHQVTLHVPMVFYSHIIETVFAIHQRGYLDFADCQTLTRTILETGWEYHIASSDEILEMMQTQILPFERGNGEYLAVAQTLGCPLVTTSAHPVSSTAAVEILFAEQHPWSGDGAIDSNPPDN